jgi:hypothetical protein
LHFTEILPTNIKSFLALASGILYEVSLYQEMVVSANILCSCSNACGWEGSGRIYADLLFTSSIWIARFLINDAPR